MLAHLHIQYAQPRNPISSNIAPLAAHALVPPAAEGCSALACSVERARLACCTECLHDITPAALCSHKRQVQADGSIPTCQNDNPNLWVIPGISEAQRHLVGCRTRSSASARLPADWGPQCWRGPSRQGSSLVRGVKALRFWGRLIVICKGHPASAYLRAMRSQSNLHTSLEVVPVKVTYHQLETVNTIDVRSTARLQALADQLHRCLSGPASGLTTRAGIPGQLAHHLLPASADNSLGPCPG